MRSLERSYTRQQGVPNQKYFRDKKKNKKKNRGDHDGDLDDRRPGDSESDNEENVEVALPVVVEE